jgi:hypothetical protein
MIAAIALLALITAVFDIDLIHGRGKTFATRAIWALRRQRQTVPPSHGITLFAKPSLVSDHNDTNLIETVTFLP